MDRFWVALSIVLVMTHAVAVSAKESVPPDYEKALDLVHSFSGAGDELRRAMAIAESLSRSHPKRGYAETIVAEMQSTFNLGQDGQPDELRAQILALTDEALRLNPDLAQAYVVRARVFVRMSQYDLAGQAIDAALRLDPANSGAYFLRAEMFRRTDRVAEAETWYLKFIAGTPSITRKANGYGWLATLYEDAAWRSPTLWASLVSKARGAHEKGLELDPNSAWRNVNFAIFLNNQAGDYVAAERHAAKALRIMDFPMARFHLAIARYQKLVDQMGSMDKSKLETAAANISAATGITLDDALEFCGTCVGIAGRLQRLRARLAAGKSSGLGFRGQSAAGSRSTGPFGCSERLPKESLERRAVLIAASSRM
jgi:tetratricopeptide (TPR) repeat protein